MSKENQAMSKMYIVTVNEVEVINTGNRKEAIRKAKEEADNTQSSVPIIEHDIDTGNENVIMVVDPIKS